MQRRIGFQRKSWIGGYSSGVNVHARSISASLGASIGAPRDGASGKAPAAKRSQEQRQQVRPRAATGESGEGGESRSSERTIPYWKGGQFFL